MLNRILFPALNQIQIEKWNIESQLLTLNIYLQPRQARCPDCETFSDRIHSRYRRTIFDLPCAGLAVKIIVTVRRFFCPSSSCPRVTFAEQIDDLAPRYARRTKRLIETQRLVGFELGGEAGKRLLSFFGLPISGDLLLEFVRKAPEKVFPEPRVLGVDDWAFRRGQVYGTILVDLERRRTVDLLPDRESETLANWLRQHPGIAIIARDRSLAYKEGIRLGAPQAIQVADRFHLLRNLLDALVRVFERRPEELREVNRQIASVFLYQPNDLPGDESIQATTGDLSAEGEIDPITSLIENRFSSRTVRFSEVKDLQKQGLSRREVARRSGLARRTVNRYFYLDQPPEKTLGPQSVSKVTPYLQYLEKRWRDGIRTRTALFQELRSQGFEGSYASLWRALAKFPKNGKFYSSYPHIAGLRCWSPRQAAWVLLSKPELLSPKQDIGREILCQTSVTAETAYPLVQLFAQMVRERRAVHLDEWIRAAGNTKIPELKRFAKGLQEDYEAVKAALETSWSNGPVEGHVNRLKLIKRSMYGRSKFALLRRRVLGAPLPP